MTTKFLVGDDGREYVVTSDSHIADDVTRIGIDYIFINATSYVDTDNLCLKLVKPQPIGEVPLKDIVLQGYSK